MDSVIAETLRRIASSIATVSPSPDSSLRTLVPPEIRSTTGMSDCGGTHRRSTPRVSMRESAYGRSGTMVLPGSSRPPVGPRK